MEIAFVGGGAEVVPNAPFEHERAHDQRLLAEHVDQAHTPAVHRDHRRDPRLVLLGQADPELEPVRLGDLLLEERPQTATVDAPHDLADEVAVGERVVAVATPGSHSGSCTSSARITGSHASASAASACVDGRQPCLVAEQPAHRDVLLPGLPELGPVLHDRRVDVEQAALGQQVRATPRSHPWSTRTRSAACPRRTPRRCPRAHHPRCRRPWCPRRRTRRSRPTSPCSTKLFANASRTPSNPGSTCPPTSAAMGPKLTQSESEANVSQRSGSPVS